MDKLRLQEGVLPRDILEDVRKAASILRRYGAVKIILYGSLARGDYREDSDIDICYDGMPERR